MTAVQPDIWFSSLAFSVVALLATIVRCAMLLVGLLVTLSRAAERDRPYIFREFAHAIIRRTLPTRNPFLFPLDPDYRAAPKISTPVR